MRNQVLRAHNCNYLELCLDVLSALAIDDPCVAKKVISVRELPHCLQEDASKSRAYATLVELLHAFRIGYVIPQIEQQKQRILSARLPATASSLTQKWSMNMEREYKSWAHSYSSSIRTMKTQSRNNTLYIGPACWMNYGASFGYSMPHICATEMLSTNEYPLRLKFFTVRKDEATFYEYTRILARIPQVDLIDIDEPISLEMLLEYYLSGGTDGAFEQPLFLLGERAGVRSHINYRSFTGRPVINRNSLTVGQRLDQQKAYQHSCKRMIETVRSEFGPSYRAAGSALGDIIEGNNKIILIANRDERWVGNGQHERNTDVRVLTRLVERLTKTEGYIVIRINTVGEPLPYRSDKFIDLAGKAISAAGQAYIISKGSLCIGSSSGITDSPRLMFGIPTLFIDGNTCHNFFFTLATMLAPKNLRICNKERFKQSNMKLLLDYIFKEAWSKMKLQEYGLTLENLSPEEIEEDAMEYIEYIFDGRLRDISMGVRGVVNAVFKGEEDKINAYPDTLLSSRATLNILSITRQYRELSDHLLHE